MNKSLLICAAAVFGLMALGATAEFEPDPTPELPYYCVKGSVSIKMSDPARCAMRKLADNAWELKR